MDRLDELQVFLAILDAGSLAAAARKLRRSPSAVTRILTMLEDRVGVRLFERTTRRLTASDEGLRLAENARRLLADYETCFQEHHAPEPRGLLRISAPMVFGRRHLAPIVTKFLVRYPEVQVDLILSDRNVNLFDEDIDATLRIGPLENSGLIARKLGEVCRVTVASPKYLRRCGQPSTPSELEGHELILGTTIWGISEWRYASGGHEQVVRFTPRLQVNDVEALLGAARDGFGIARALSYQVAPDLASGKLVRLLSNYELDRLPVHLVLRSTRHMTPRLRAFVDFVVEAMEGFELIQSLAGH
jgi:DNA-binding transcriptional LysR family regulator